MASHSDTQTTQRRIMDLFLENVVVTANNFNITLVTQLWLVDHGIVLRDEFIGPQVFTPALVQVTTPQFQFLAIQNQIQFTLTGEEEQKQQLIDDRLGQFVSLLPHTPFTALGINFIWHFKPSEDTTVAAIGRRLFFRNDTPFAKAFDSPDAKFGAYYSKDALGFRLKLSTAPVDMRRDDRPTEEVIQFSFNYHLESKNAAEIREALKRWHDAKQHSMALINEIEAGL